MDHHHRFTGVDHLWKDLDFDPKLRAFYYARVIEIPTPRWTAYFMIFEIKEPLISRSILS